MQFVKLRLAGFKSFIDPAELVIEQGLTGLVGPNGCGKSNLAEALRWVMGENSYKTMRAGRGEDVIFAGSASRIAANFAEVTLYLDNSDFSASSAFNSEAELQISRRIGRDGLSLYRLNGREIRARNVQFLFADQASGAHSPAQVGQGRISALLEARPQARRALLEEAAGIGGLQARREAAEQRLRATDANLARAEEILADLSSRLAALRAQAAAAARFKHFSAEIRRLEARLFHIRRREIEAAVQQAERELTLNTQILAEKHAQYLQAEQKAEFMLAALPPLQIDAAAAGAARQHLWLEHERLEAEQKHAAARMMELAAQRQQIAGDRQREEELLAENSAILQKIDEEEADSAAAKNETSGDINSLAASVSALAARREQAELRLSQARQAAAAAKAAWAEKQNRERFYAQAKSGLEDKAAALKKTIAELAQQQERDITAVAETAQIRQNCQALWAQSQEKTRRAAAELALQAKKQEAWQKQAETSGTALVQSQAQLHALQEIRLSAERELGQQAANPVCDQIKVEQGYDLALSAALGEALTASTDSEAALCWRDIVPASAEIDSPLPAVATALTNFVRAPQFMQRALAQIGLVSPQIGEKLQQDLRPGQILVSKEGALWRWDGFTKTAQAPDNFAVYRHNRSREDALQQAVAAATAAHAENMALLSAAEAERAKLAAALEKQQNKQQILQQQQQAATAEAAAAAQKQGETASRLACLQENYAEIGALIEENQKNQQQAARIHENLPPLAEAESVCAELQADYTLLQAEFIRQQANWQAQQKQEEAAAARIEAVIQARQNWQKHRAAAERHLAELAARAQAAENEQQKLQQAVATCQQNKKKVFAALDKAEKQEKNVNEALAKAEAGQKQAAKAAHLAEQALGTAREARSRADERLHAAIRRKKDIEEDNATRLGKIFMPEEEGRRPTAIKAGQAEDFSAEAERGTIEELEKELATNRARREKLGAVNLQAEEESTAGQAHYDTLAGERDDIAAAQAKLRQAIGDLNREGRARLRAAFEQINNRFGQLFQRLFGGGRAELQWVDSDDPLNIGLEILVCPPGKKLENISLLSGGEQCLTALSLIFAVFLTNPAPICVLDEADAPLDDYNVERYCRLLRDMTAQTKTRFLVITHNPITMAHMDRLFGVTMIEKGLSTLVSVDLQRAVELTEI